MNRYSNLIKLSRSFQSDLDSNDSEFDAVSGLFPFSSSLSVSFKHFPPNLKDIPINNEEDKHSYIDSIGNLVNSLEVLGNLVSKIRSSPFVGDGVPKIASQIKTSVSQLFLVASSKCSVTSRIIPSIKPSINRNRDINRDIKKQSSIDSLVGQDIDTHLSSPMIPFDTHLFPPLCHSVFIEGNGSEEAEQLKEIMDKYRIHCLSQYSKKGTKETSSSSPSPCSSPSVQFEGSKDRLEKEEEEEFSENELYGNDSGMDSPSTKKEERKSEQQSKSSFDNLEGKRIEGIPSSPLISSPSDPLPSHEDKFSLPPLNIFSAQCLSLLPPCVRSLELSNIACIYSNIIDMDIEKTFPILERLKIDIPHHSHRNVVDIICGSLKTDPTSPSALGYDSIYSFIHSISHSTLVSLSITMHGSDLSLSSTNLPSLRHLSVEGVKQLFLHPNQFKAAIKFHHSPDMDYDRHSFIPGIHRACREDLNASPSYSIPSSSSSLLSPSTIFPSLTSFSCFILSQSVDHIYSILDSVPSTLVSLSFSPSFLSAGASATLISQSYTPGAQQPPRQQPQDASTASIPRLSISLLQRSRSSSAASPISPILLSLGLSSLLELKEYIILRFPALGMREVESEFHLNGDVFDVGVIPHDAKHSDIEYTVLNADAKKNTATIRKRTIEYYKASSNSMTTTKIPSIREAKEKKDMIIPSFFESWSSNISIPCLPWLDNRIHEEEELESLQQKWLKQQRRGVTTGNVNNSSKNTSIYRSYPKIDIINNENKRTSVKIVSCLNLQRKCIKLSRREKLMLKKRNKKKRIQHRMKSQFKKNNNVKLFQGSCPIPIQQPIVSQSSYNTSSCCSIFSPLPLSYSWLKLFNFSLSTPSNYRIGVFHQLLEKLTFPDQNDTDPVRNWRQYVRYMADILHMSISLQYLRKRIQERTINSDSIFRRAHMPIIFCEHDGRVNLESTNKNALLLVNNSVSIILRVFKRFVFRRKVLATLHSVVISERKRSLEAKHRNEAAICIQRVFRGHIGRSQAQTRRNVIVQQEQERIQKEREELSAKIIQHWWYKNHLSKQTLIAKDLLKQYLDKQVRSKLIEEQRRREEEQRRREEEQRRREEAKARQRSLDKDLLADLDLSHDIEDAIVTDSFLIAGIDDSLYADVGQTTQETSGKRPEEEESHEESTSTTSFSDLLKRKKEERRKIRLMSKGSHQSFSQEEMRERERRLEAEQWRQQRERIERESERALERERSGYYHESPDAYNPNARQIASSGRAGGYFLSESDDGTSDRSHMPIEHVSVHHMASEEEISSGIVVAHETSPHDEDEGEYLPSGFSDSSRDQSGTTTSQRGKKRRREKEHDIGEGSSAETDLPRMFVLAQQRLRRIAKKKEGASSFDRIKRFRANARKDVKVRERKAPRKSNSHVPLVGDEAVFDEATGLGVRISSSRRRKEEMLAASHDALDLFSGEPSDSMTSPCPSASSQSSMSLLSDLSESTFRPDRGSRKNDPNYRMRRKNAMMSSAMMSSVSRKSKSKSGSLPTYIPSQDKSRGKLGMSGHVVLPPLLPPELRIKKKKKRE
ncbi:hypothetical protein ADUPG1_008058 [Aduncisulcus paluster]|uniref:Uncharacterized protein n=1 Tax=Aduncisulcus paluster TaxID=2918883 RepID=A0ABQ5KUQ9_9EUKA|nr:hypothetical protein ADUPG1_008058 [Aduncisulcus paluster]